MQTPKDLLVIQFCCKCKDPACLGIFPLEIAVRTVEPEYAPAYVKLYAKDFEPRRISCSECHQEYEYFPQDVGHTVLGE